MPEPVKSPEVDYHKYMASRDWALKREAVKERAGNICERCEEAYIANVHHLTYQNLGDEPLHDLQGLCRPCHAFLSAKSSDDPIVLLMRSLLQKGIELIPDTLVPLFKTKPTEFGFYYIVLFGEMAASKSTFSLQLDPALCADFYRCYAK